MVVLDSSSTSLDQDLALAGAVRAATSAKVGMLGSQVTFTPDEIFEGGRIDFVVRGEPEFTVRDLARRVAAGESVAGTPGITWQPAGGEIVHEPEREKIKDLDELPLPARHLLDNQAYRFPGVDGPITTVKSSADVRSTAPSVATPWPRDCASASARPSTSWTSSATSTSSTASATWSSGTRSSPRARTASWRSATESWSAA